MTTKYKPDEIQYFPPTYKNRPSEAEIQAELYCDLLMLGLNPRIEVGGRTMMKYSDGQVKRKTVRFDVVVYWPKTTKPICIIEAKRFRRSNTYEPQLMLYKGFKLPIFICNPYNHVATIAGVREMVVEKKDEAPANFDWVEFHKGFHEKIIFGITKIKNARFRFGLNYRNCNYLKYVDDVYNKQVLFQVSDLEALKEGSIAEDADCVSPPLGYKITPPL